MNFIEERGAVNASHNNFRHFLQAQLTNWRPYTVHYHQPQQYQTHFNTTNHYTMAEQQSYTPTWAPQPSPLHHTENRASTPSFFRDSFDYSAEEAACFNPSQQKLEHKNAFRPLDTLTQPFHPASIAPTAATVAPTALVRKEGSAMLRLETDVDPAQYQPVHIDDWRRASIPFDTDDEEDTSSPTSTQATSLGPFTPASSDGELTFAEAAIRRHSLDLMSVGSFGSDMFSNPSFGLQPHSSEVAGTDHVTAAPQPHMGFQYGDLYTRRYAGLPLTDSDLSTLTPTVADEKINPAVISQGTFCDVNGLPTVLPIRSKKRNSTSSTRTASSSAGSMSSSTTEAGSDLTLVHTAQDQYLLDMRDKGYTYRHIKRVGRFTEAESTLRGRVRVLTKDKSKRVRKPEWSGNDVRLLPTIN